jgi:predicted transcriptional regulator
MKSVALPDDLVTAVSELAQASGKTTDEVVEDATRRYVAHQRLDRLVRRNEGRATALGITEDDVPRVIEQWRREQQ